jgi:pyruvate dehydrogenase E2 component (dihydrolipoamide acetyltransferase)
VRISPLARKVAAALGVDVTTVTGTGPGGAIERADVERAAAQKSPAPAGTVEPAPAPAPEAAPAPALPSAPPPHPPRTDALAGMRRAIASAMARSNREIPHYHLATRIDMSLALAWLEAENARRPIQDRLLPAAVLLAAVARTLKQHPDLNGAWIDNALVRRDAIHINFAIATRQGGLITPAVHDVDKKSIHEIMAALHDLIPRARDGGLRSSELSEGTITVTSLGDLGVETVFGVIYPPQVALIGFGRITEEPWAENGMLDVRPVLHATLAGDHRATDGRTGARFLDALNRQFQHPETL